MKNELLKSGSFSFECVFKRGFPVEKATNKVFHGKRVLKQKSFRMKRQSSQFKKCYEKMRKNYFFTMFLMAKLL